MKFGIEIFQSFSPNVKRLILRPRITNNYRRCNYMPMKMKHGVCGEGQVTL
jgi:hypothetical protein